MKFIIRADDYLHVSIFATYIRKFIIGILPFPVTLYKYN